MKHISLLSVSVILFITLSITSCQYSISITDFNSKNSITGEGVIKAVRREASEFRSITLNGEANIHIIKGDETYLIVKSYENVLPYLEIKVTSSTLELGFNRNCRIKNPHLEVFIIMPELENLTIAGAGVIDVEGYFTGKTLTSIISGSGDLFLGQGIKYNEMNAIISGSGNINAKNAEINNCLATISGSGDISVSVKSALNVIILGSGEVYYLGEPQLKTHITGSGSVNKL